MAKKQQRTPSSRNASARKSTPELPAALAKRAKAQHASRIARLAVVGRAAIARVRERQTDIAASAVDMGLAIAELRVDAMPEALGRKDFAEVCALDLGMSVETAKGFVALATRAPREVVKSLGIERARAAIELVDAMGEGRAIEDVLREPLKLASGRMFDVTAASAKEIREASKEIRASRDVEGATRSRGFTATPAEKRAFRGLVQRFETHGGAGASRLLATRGGKGARVRFEVSLSDVAAFAEALRKATRG